ncbi:hypothetical protein XU18_1958 [Perkinsela sp. CCAP 1560/4]|nr:hypothetical protein XU18_1958 [Perkinsela sp. CCAP 1560/4]|eukprot:KNH07426.1 hypothetical protein XU18_1958 [Perkinsela sp. CCAP 1560/4]
MYSKSLSDCIFCLRTLQVPSSTYLSLSYLFTPSKMYNSKFLQSAGWVRNAFGLFQTKPGKGFCASFQHFPSWESSCGLTFCLKNLSFGEILHLELQGELYTPNCALTNQGLTRRRTPLRGGLDQYPSFGGSQEPFQTPRRVSVMAPTLLMAIARWWVRTSTQPLGRFGKPPNYFQGENLLGGETREDIY